ncbi:reverse transcriptase [Lasius niger]|uniref:Reverse transcriptase n=1 Tax=Lasius niger TaxID=67767 RepID=A0A0J7KTQ3_LASNI|nr:reverse transcriptase [Lasius niger]
MLKELPEKALRFLTIIYNAILRLNHFPVQWKVAQIILLPKPGKNLEDITSYRPISLLPVAAKVFEKLLLKRIRPELEKNNFIPDHQFGFRQQHSTIEQVHRIVRKINNDLEEKRYCSAVFLDVSQAFDKVWHLGLLYKIKKYLPHNYYLLLKSYITDRHFLVRYQEIYTTLRFIESGVPQGSVLGPFLYLLYTSDLPVRKQTTTATFADDTAIMASHVDPKIATENLQESIKQIQTWLKTWRIKVNEQKSVHVTFTLKKKICPPIMINNMQIPQHKSTKYLGMHLDSK